MMEWRDADKGELYTRMTDLAFELKLAATLLECREESNENIGLGRSTVVTDLQKKWKGLLEAKPIVKQEEAA